MEVEHNIMMVGKELTPLIDFNAFPNLTIPVKVDFMNNFSGLKDFQQMS